MDTLPLASLRVLEMTLARAGPTAGRHLADWGADVIRIEPPLNLAPSEDFVGRRQGDDSQNLHRNKRSIGLDLKSEEGRLIFLELASKSDVIIENMRSNVKHKLGIDYEAVRAVNPRIIYGSISGFGQTGPYKDRPGVDQIVQGMGGLMSVTGLPGQGPVRAGIPVIDLCAGAYLAQAILIALIDRERTGKGAWVRTSLLETQVAMLDFQAARYLRSGEVAGQAGNDHPTSIPSGVFPCADGHVSIAAAGERLWTRFCKAIGREEWISDPNYLTGKQRSKNRVALNAAISEVTRTRTGEEWAALLNEAGVPCGPINTVDRVFADPQVQHLRVALPWDGDPEQKPAYVSQPAQIGDYRRSVRRRMPDLGADTDDVLRWLGHSPESIEKLRHNGVI